MSDRHEPRRVGESLDQLTRSLSGVGAQPLASVFSEWPRVVGETLAAHTRPVSLDGSRLVIAVEESAWATQVRYLERELIARIAEVVGGQPVASIEVRVAPSERPARKPRKGG